MNTCTSLLLTEEKQILDVSLKLATSGLIHFKIHFAEEWQRSGGENQHGPSNRFCAWPALDPLENE